MRVAVDQHHVGLLPNLYGPGLVLDTQGRLAASLVETLRTAFGLIPASIISYISRTMNPWPAWELPASVPVAIFTASIARRKLAWLLSLIPSREAWSAADTPETPLR